jgi:F-type H+-transporting ATPase subunit a
MRAILALSIVLAACWVSHSYSEHHVGRNAFETLYMHLVPAKLVAHAEHAEEGGEAHAEHGASSAHAGAQPLLEVPLPAFLGVLDWRGAVPSGEGPKTVLFNLQVFQVAAVLLVLVLFSGVAGYLRTGHGDRVSRLMAGFASWVRDEMVYPQMGKELGRKFLPYFLCVFFFVLFMNLMGLVPFSATATASIFVTAALALTTLLAMVVCGMVAQGPIAFWKNLVPHVPLALWPLMFVVELIGLLVKPFALMVRLFANMSGGHMVVLSFMGLIFFFAAASGAGAGWGSSPIAVAFAVFIMIIESFVALLQAYIFTQLSVIFVNAAVHPEH